MKKFFKRKEGKKLCDFVVGGYMSEEIILRIVKLKIVYCHLGTIIMSLNEIYIYIYLHLK